MPCFWFGADVDGDGLIDYNEFVAATMHLSKLEKEELLQNAFKQIDKVGPQQLQRMARSFGLTPMFAPAPAPRTHRPVVCLPVVTITNQLVPIYTNPSQEAAPFHCMCQLITCFTILLVSHMPAPPFAAFFACRMALAPSAWRSCQRSSNDLASTTTPRTCWQQLTLTATA